MTTILIRFPARRYHATSWGHHVNEGLIEWPPSPWRLLRSFIAVGYSSGIWNGDGPTPVGRSLIEKLATTLPYYGLPPVSGAHSRHFMPTNSLDKNGQPNRTLVFDTWAQVDDGKLAVTWDVELHPEENSLMAALVERLGYMGRSESWIDARLLGADEAIPEADACTPSDDPPPPGWEQVSLLAPQLSTDYAEWRKSALDKIPEASLEIPPGKKKETKKQLDRMEKAIAPYPIDLVDCLQKDTSWWHKYGWSQPPGSRRVFYRRKVSSIEAGAPEPRFFKPVVQSISAMLLSLTTKSGNTHALPPITRTLPQAELLHRALTSHATRDGETCPVLTGCDKDGKPLQGPHSHSHILPLDLDGDGHLDHILVWSPEGLDGDAQRAVRSVRQTYTKGAIEPLRLALVGSGTLDDLRCLPGDYGQRLCSVLGPEGGSCQWTSLNPFVAPRYLKKTGRNTLAGQISAELVSRGILQPTQVRILSYKDHPGLLRHRHFIRKRRTGPQPPADFGYALEIRFDQPVRGPICIGYGSHFGLGLFRTLSGSPQRARTP